MNKMPLCRDEVIIRCYGIWHSFIWMICYWEEDILFECVMDQQISFFVEF